MLRRLFDILSVFKEYLLFGFLILISISLLALNDSAQIRAIRSLTVASVGALQGTFGSIPNIFGLRSENRVLRELNVTLSDEVSRLRAAKSENIRLRGMLALKERVQDRYASANVIGKNIQLLRNTITIDVGEDDGVRANMPIITDAGLVGKVVASSGRYAIGQTLFNKDFRASAKVERSRVDGILMWEGGDLLSLKHVAKTLDVQVGDDVITSEYSNIFPAGIKIGTVSKTSQIPGELFQSIEIAPAVAFSRLEEVFVIKRSADSSRVAIERQFVK
jgi:rod shape-determining protein MreC